MSITSPTNNTKRLRLLDAYRGITILSMIAFHTCWDLVYFGLGLKAEFLYGRGAYVWQQSICISFILISGFCFHYGKHHLKRGLMSLGGGILITIVTCLVIPDERDVFGVLWMLGSCMLIFIPLDKLISKNNKKFVDLVAMLCMLLMFVFFRGINRGYIGISFLKTQIYSQRLYKGYVMTYLGFTDPSFYSSDYFSLIPWIFLFASGYFLQKVLRDTNFERNILTKEIKIFRPLEYIGKKSFIIYMLHQVVIYGIVYLLSIII